MFCKEEIKIEQVKNNKQRKLTIGLFIVYFLVLTWIILFKMNFSFEDLVSPRSINLIPFGDSTIVNDRIDIKEIIYNMIVFIPFGIYVCMITDKWSVLKKILSIAGVSLSYEVLQFIFAIGAFDITDLIGNTFGGVVGIAIYYFISKLFKSNQKMNKVLNIIALILTILIVLFLTILIVVNL
ncbi:VanZ family protein [Paeniclostridium sp. NSJ-45]|uniref:VanZ family protein n=1 Tax=Paeniclostridium hominis TaxID=2764329 RepID=A0ABR7K1H3_9FIRM|nr:MULTISPECIES: VanZ family protein [Paeniclostridium]MBC6002968.1 VanZ family protein [Paeniclostridium hominis]